MIVKTKKQKNKNLDYIHVDSHDNFNDDIIKVAIKFT
jgi:hypothetical protein